MIREISVLVDMVTRELTASAGLRKLGAIKQTDVLIEKSDKNN